MPEPYVNTWINTEKDFCSKWNFSNGLRDVYGKHASIRTPTCSGLQFYCYKKHFWIVFPAFVDADYRLFIVDSGSYTKNSDGSKCSNSVKCRRLINISSGVPAGKALINTTLPLVKVGDEAFLRRRNLMRPFPRDNLNHSKKIYFRYRRVAENAFGIYATQWGSSRDHSGAR